MALVSRTASSASRTRVDGDGRPEGLLADRGESSGTSTRMVGWTNAPSTAAAGQRPGRPAASASAMCRLMTSSCPGIVIGP